MRPGFVGAITMEPPDFNCTRSDYGSKLSSNDVGKYRFTLV
jgi:hypothetical protein